MRTSLFNPFRPLLREKAPENVTSPGESNPAPMPAAPPAVGNENPAPEEGEDAIELPEDFLAPGRLPQLRHRTG